MGWGAKKKNCMDPIVLKRIKNLLKNAIFVQFLIPSVICISLDCLGWAVCYITQVEFWQGLYMGSH